MQRRRIFLLIASTFLLLLFFNADAPAEARISTRWNMRNTRVARGDHIVCQQGFRLIVGERNPDYGSEILPVPLIPSLRLSNYNDDEIHNTTLPPVRWIPMPAPEYANNSRVPANEIVRYAVIEYRFPELNEEVYRVYVEVFGLITFRVDDQSEDCLDSPEGLIDYEAIMRSRDPNGENRVLVEAGAPVAAYCYDETFDVYTIDPETGNGIFAMQVSLTDIADSVETAVSTGTNTLIAEGLQQTSLWALSSREIQINAYDARDPGKLYERIFPADICG